METNLKYNLHCLLNIRKDYYCSLTDLGRLLGHELLTLWWFQVSVYCVHLSGRDLFTYFGGFRYLCTVYMYRSLTCSLTLVVLGLCVLGLSASSRGDTPPLWSTGAPSSWHGRLCRWAGDQLHVKLQTDTQT